MAKKKIYKKKEKYFHPAPGTTIFDQMYEYAMRSPENWVEHMKFCGLL